MGAAADFLAAERVELLPVIGRSGRWRRQHGTNHQAKPVWCGGL